MRATPGPREAERLALLNEFAVLDTPAEPEFDELTALAAEICGCPVALVSMVGSDRQWFKSHHGTDLQETGTEYSVCTHAILGPDLLQIPDTHLDPRTADNPFVGTGGTLRFYAGQPLVSSEGLALGTLCVLDHEPRRLTDFQTRALGILSRQVMAQLELRRALALKDTMAREVDHRVKNSLQQISSLMRMQEAAVDPLARPAIAAARQRIGAVARVHAEMQKTSTGLLPLADFLDHLTGDLSESLGGNLTLATTGPNLEVPVALASALAIIVNEFVANSIKHGFPDGRDGRVSIEWSTVEGGGLSFHFADDGIGHEEGTRPGLGSRLMLASAMQLGAAYETRSRPGEGTWVRLHLPAAALASTHAA
ncbi:histidine kinase dimerization/phosphoacceptor domain -containing protein [Frigidibacter sp. MR17.24]|uniref:histidine kinase dimerization/phosphoacceptor domain -containing protein n=1 Tax=Frigidibacter sp. MR17.24 TaxID=3127345 RepID=UPI003012F00E